MGGRLAAAGFSPFFDKGPDLLFEFAGLKVAVQCKRPFSASGLERNIRKAISQLEEAKAELGLIAISVSRLLNPGDPNGRRNVREDRFAYNTLVDPQCFQVTDAAVPRAAETIKWPGVRKEIISWPRVYEYDHERPWIVVAAIRMCWPTILPACRAQELEALFRQERGVHKAGLNPSRAVITSKNAVSGPFNNVPDVYSSSSEIPKWNP